MTAHLPCTGLNLNGPRFLAARAFACISGQTVQGEEWGAFGLLMHGWRDRGGPGLAVASLRSVVWGEWRLGKDHYYIPSPSKSHTYFVISKSCTYIDNPAF